MVETMGDEWPVTWRENREDQLRTTLWSTPGQRLEWLEEAMRLAYDTQVTERASAHRQSAPRRRDPEADTT